MAGIKTTAIIDKCEIKKGSNTIKFKNLKLTAGQVEQMADVVNDGGQVNITIEPVQGNLPGIDEEMKKSKKGKKDGKKLAANDKTEE
jgi:hypothetical protein